MLECRSATALTKVRFRAMLESFTAALYSCDVDTDGKIVPQTALTVTRPDEAQIDIVDLAAVLLPFAVGTSLRQRPPSAVL